MTELTFEEISRVHWESEKVLELLDKLPYHVAGPFVFTVLTQFMGKHFRHDVKLCEQILFDNFIGVSNYVRSLNAENDKTYKKDLDAPGMF